MTTDHERQEAVREVARILHGRLLPTLDAEHVAGLAVDALHAIDWRHVPRPPGIPTAARSGDPPNTEWRKAREQLTRPEGDQQ
ncbi:hypothetical protein OHR68_09845 [Spirillospora sp. NBC_00431]